MEVYKLLTMRDNKLLSFNIGQNEEYIENDTILEYFPEQRIYPVYGKLYAFDQLYDAKSFATKFKSRDPRVIWKATAAKCYKEPVICMQDKHLKYNVFWKKLFNHAYIPPRLIENAPYGTVLCHWIRLIEPVTIPQ